MPTERRHDRAALLHMTAPLRDDFDDPVPRPRRCRRQPPRLALVAGIHGNELNGIFVLARLARFLRERRSRRAGSGPRSCGRVLVVPAVNVLGVNTRVARWPFDGTDMNRMFPGYDGGETTQRIANAVLMATRDAAVRVDIHSSNLDFEELPQVRLYDPLGRRAPDRHALRPARGGRAAVSSTIFSAPSGTPGAPAAVRASSSRPGCAGDLQPQHCERLFRALVPLLHRTGVLRGTRLADEDHDVHYFGPARPCRWSRSGPASSSRSVDVGTLAAGRRPHRLRLRRLRRQRCAPRCGAAPRPAERPAPPAAPLRGRSRRPAAHAGRTAGGRGGHLSLRSRPVAGPPAPRPLRGHPVHLRWAVREGPARRAWCLRDRLPARVMQCVIMTYDGFGERRLMLAVLEDAIRTLLLARRTAIPRKRLLRDLEWVESTSQTEPFAFETICDVLGIDPGYLRGRLATGAFGRRGARTRVARARRFAGRRGRGGDRARPRTDGGRRSRGLSSRAC